MKYLTEIEQIVKALDLLPHPEGVFLKKPIEVPKPLIKKILAINMREKGTVQQAFIFY